MSSSISASAKKRGRPVTTGTPRTIGVRAPADVLEALERWRREHPEQGPTRAGAITYALRDWLTGLGYLPHRDDPEMAN